MATKTRIDAKRLESEFALRVKAEFIPFSQSRNANTDFKSLNWRVTLQTCPTHPVAGEIHWRDVLTTEYSAGTGHCPGDKLKLGKYEKRSVIAAEIETGRAHTWPNWAQSARAIVPASPIMPDAANVVYSLIMDAEVIDYAGFEDWAANFGYDTDSRKGEQIYRDCLEIGLKLRAIIGDAKLSALREEFQDF